MENRCSLVIPEGPATAPRRALRTFLANLVQFECLLWNSIQQIWRRGRPGRLSGFVNDLRVLKFPGANSALSRTFRATLNPPTIAFSARAALWSASPFLRTAAALADSAAAQPSLATQDPQRNLSARSCSFLRAIRPLPRGRVWHPTPPNEKLLLKGMMLIL